MTRFGQMWLASIWRRKSDGWFWKFQQASSISIMLNEPSYSEELFNLHNKWHEMD